MISIGEWNDLEIRREKDFGVYLGCNGDDREILLPRRQVPEKAQMGDIIHVFIYRDSDDRLIATVNAPYISMDSLAVLRCAGTTKIGAFMDWGLEKDILLPFKEQMGTVREGHEYLVRMYKDKSERLCVSMKVYDYLESDSPYQKGDEIDGIVIEYNRDYGAFVAVDERYLGLIPVKELHTGVYVGDRVHGRVTEVRDDGKLNLTLQKPIKQQIKENTDMVKDIIVSYGGRLPFNDKADASVIEKEFGISKRAFKAAVGRLLRENRIRITEDSIVMLSDEERKSLPERPETRKKPEPEIKAQHLPKKGKVKFTSSQSGRRNNRRAMLAELDSADEGDSDK